MNNTPKEQAFLNALSAAPMSDADRDAIYKSAYAFVLEQQEQLLLIAEDQQEMLRSYPSWSGTNHLTTKAA